jgi:peroxiredoxin
MSVACHPFGPRECRGTLSSVGFLAKEKSMRRFALVASLLAVLSLVAVAQAQAPKALKIGNPCPDFHGLETTAGKKVSLDDFKQDVLVVCITCNHCPVAVAYENRLIDFCKKHCGDSSKIGFLAINVNNIAADKMDKMIERAKEKGFNFTYAYDPSQEIGKKLGASVTPEFFVFNKERKLVYHGAMDDNQNASKATKNYLEDACMAAVNGQTPSLAETRPVGCSIKYESGK